MNQPYSHTSHWPGYLSCLLWEKPETLNLVRDGAMSSSSFSALVSNLKSKPQTSSPRPLLVMSYTEKQN